MNRLVMMTLALSLSIAPSCSKKDEMGTGEATRKGEKKKQGPSACENAREIQIAAARKYGRPVLPNLDTESQKSLNAAAEKKFDEFIARVQKEFVPVCEELGPDKVLRCVTANAEAPKSGDAILEDCLAILKEFNKRIPGPKSDSKVPALVLPAAAHAINMVTLGEDGKLEALAEKLRGFDVKLGSEGMDDGAVIAAKVIVSKDETTVATISLDDGKISEVRVMDPEYGFQDTMTRVGTALPDIATVVSCYCSGEDGSNGFYCSIGGNQHAVYEAQADDCGLSSAEEFHAALKDRKVMALSRREAN